MVDPAESADEALPRRFWPVSEAGASDACNGEVFNVASGEHRSIVEIAHDITAKMDYSRDRIEFIGDRPGQVVRHTGDWSKINRVLGWAPTLTWDEGLSRTIEWYRENTERWSRQLFLRKIPITTAEGKKEYH